MSMMLVALRKESVDRNVFWTALNHQSKRVALRKESVDRNRLKILKMSIIPKSLSARRAWIEIIDNLTQGVFNLVALRKESVDRNVCRSNGCRHYSFVALRKESVDRNPYLTNYHFTLLLSLSARRAWIEINYNAQ